MEKVVAPIRGSQQGRWGNSIKQREDPVGAVSVENPYCASGTRSAVLRRTNQRPNEWWWCYCFSTDNDLHCLSIAATPNFLLLPTYEAAVVISPSDTVSPKRKGLLPCLDWLRAQR